MTIPFYLLPYEHVHASVGLTPCPPSFSFGQAIDNVTRKLLRDGRTPLTVGLWFSLGHCSVVFIACVAVSCGYKLMQDNGTFEFANSGAAVGMIVSASVLFFIGAVNFIQSLYLLKVALELVLSILRRSVSLQCMLLICILSI